MHIQSSLLTPWTRSSIQGSEAQYPRLDELLREIVGRKLSLVNITTVRNDSFYLTLQLAQSERVSEHRSLPECFFGVTFICRYAMSMRGGRIVEVGNTADFEHRLERN